jgi:hypothetical protein
MNRRNFLVSTAAVSSSALLTGCEQVLRAGDQLRPATPTQELTAALVDAHAHLFNATDIPAVEFIVQVVLKQYRPVVPDQNFTTQSRGLLGGLTELFLAILGADEAPTASEEAALLRSGTITSDTSQNGRELEEEAIANVAKFFRRANSVSSLRNSANINLLEAEIVQAASSSRTLSQFAPSRSAADIRTVRAAYNSETQIGVHLRWFALFKMYRYQLLNRLIDLLSPGNPTLSSSKIRPLLITPALVDYEYWLREKTSSTPAEQVDVMAALSAYSGRAALHAYAPFDPLRKLYFNFDKTSTFDPVELIRNSLSQGIIGVKLYPPMGFRAIDNDEELLFPEHIAEEVGNRKIGARLDEALLELYDLCAEEGVPIITHATDSIASNEGYGRRADPSFWTRLLRSEERFAKELSVMLAHMGRFDDVALDSNVESGLEATWEWHVGEYIKEHREQFGSPCRLFVDLSYLADILNFKGSELQNTANNLKLFSDTFDPECEHIVFGTDWTMIGREENHQNYTTLAISFLRDQCGFSQSQMDNILSRNALRFLRLDRGEKNFRRLHQFRSDNGADPGALPRL